jgi:serine/threonine-protein kinase HipA
MTSERTAPDEAYVWIWLPETTAPVVAGRISREGGIYSFNYGRSYLARNDAIPIYLPELPLQRGMLVPHLRSSWQAVCAMERRMHGDGVSSSTG